MLGTQRFNTATVLFDLLGAADHIRTSDEDNIILNLSRTRTILHIGDFGGDTAGATTLCM